MSGDQDALTTVFFGGGAKKSIQHLHIAYALSAFCLREFFIFSRI